MKEALEQESPFLSASHGLRNSCMDLELSCWARYAFLGSGNWCHCHYFHLTEAEVGKHFSQVQIWVLISFLNDYHEMTDTKSEHNI